jgi:hypothetical protein
VLWRVWHHSQEDENGATARIIGPQNNSEIGRNMALIINLLIDFYLFYYVFANMK